MTSAVSTIAGRVDPMPKIYLRISDAYREGKAAVWQNVVPFPVTRTLRAAERAYRAERERVDRLECEGKYAQFNDRIPHCHFEASGNSLRPPPWRGRKK